MHFIIHNEGEVITNTAEIMKSKVLTDFYEKLYKDGVLEKYGEIRSTDDLEKLLETTTDTQKRAEIIDTIAAYTENNKTILTYNRLLEIGKSLPELISLGKSTADAFEKMAELYAACALNDSYFNVLTDMNYSDAGSYKIKNATYELINIKISYDFDANYIAEYITRDFAVKNAVDIVVGCVFDTIRDILYLKASSLGKPLANYMHLCFLTLRIQSKFLMHC